MKQFDFYATSTPLETVWSEKTRWHAALLALLAMAALASTLIAMRNSQISSLDLQWQPQVAFWKDHLDPYQEFLKLKNPRQSGVTPQLNLHLANFVLAPLGFMDLKTARLAWAIANLAFLAGILWIWRRLPDVRLPLVVGLAFVCSAALRAAISNGQITLFCLFCYTLYLNFAYDRPRLGAVFASIGAMKYSLGAPLFFQMRLTWQNLLAFATLPAAALAYWSLHFHLDLVAAMALPFKVAASIGLADDGSGDLVWLLRSVGFGPAAVYGCAASALAGISFLQRRYLPTGDRLLLFGFYATLALWLVYHRVYDFVFLLPAAIIALRTRIDVVRYGLLLATLYFWFVMSALGRAIPGHSTQIFNLLLLLTTQALIGLEIAAQRRSA